MKLFLLSMLTLILTWRQLFAIRIFWKYHIFSVFRSPRHDILKLTLASAWVSEGKGDRDASHLLKSEDRDDNIRTAMNCLFHEWLEMVDEGWKVNVSTYLRYQSLDHYRTIFKPYSRPSSTISRSSNLKPSSWLSTN